MRAVSRCGACRAFVEREDRFCWSCGSSLQGGPAASGSESAPRVRERDDETELAVRRAYLAQQRGELGEAEALLRGALERDPQHVSALGLLSEVLRRRGDQVGAVAAAQQATEAASQEGTPAGALAPARQARARIEESVVREVVGSGSAAAAGLGWQRARGTWVVLAVVGVCALFLALVATFRGELVGYLWFGVSLVAAGWCYYDAETRNVGGLLWGPLVLCLGPFGLAIYLLARY